MTCFKCAVKNREIQQFDAGGGDTSGVLVYATTDPNVTTT